MKKLILPLFIFLLLPGLAGFSDPSFPTDVPIGQTYGFEIKYNDTSVEKCFLTIYNAGDEILKYVRPLPETCQKFDNDLVCSPAQLYLQSDGTLRHQFIVDSETFLLDSTYYLVVDCGSDSYNATMTTRGGQLGNSFFNWSLFVKNNPNFISTIVIYLAPIFLIVLAILFWIFRNIIWELITLPFR